MSKNFLLSTLVAASAIGFAGVPAVMATDYTSTQEITSLPSDAISVTGSGVVLTFRHNNANSTFANALTIGEGATFQDVSNYKHSLTLSGALSGAGTLRAKIPTVSGQTDGYRNLTISGTTSAFTGTLVIEASNYTGTDLDGNLSYRTNVNLNSSDSVFAGTIKFQGVTYGGSLSTDSDTAKPTQAKLTVQKNMSVANIIGTAGIVDLGANTLTLTGTTSAFAGTVRGTGTLSVASGAVVDLSGATVKVGSAITNAGTVTLSSTTLFDLSGMTPADGNVYTVISGGTISGYENISVNNFLNVSGRSQVSTSANLITLTAGTAASLTWAGSTSSTWDTESQNWTVSGTSNADKFYNGDSVTFGTIDSDKTISVSGTVAPNAMTVDAGSGKTYTFDGSGTISATTLSVNSGTMSLSGVGVSGAISIASGATIRATSGSALGTGAITGSGRIESVGVKISNVNGLSSSSGWTGTVALMDLSQNGLNISDLGNSNSTVELSGVNGYFNGNSYSTSANIKLVNSATSGKTYAFNGSDGYTNGTWTFSGKITGDGTLSHTHSSVQTYKFTGDFSGYTGQISLGSGKLELSNASDIAFAGKIASAAAFTKSGAGTLTISAANTYTGGTTVSAGTLVAGNNSALGTGTVSVASGAKLQIASGVKLSGVSGVTLADGAKLVVDLTGKASATETFVLDLISSSAISVAGTSLASSGDITGTMANRYELVGWNKTGWTESWSYTNNTLSLTMTAAIPEPSLFGVLAGLGALALVGTRRRRRK